jgi:hypothetical protein
LREKRFHFDFNDIDSFEKFSTIPYNLITQGNKINWFFGTKLFALELKPTHIKNSLKKSSEQMQLLRDMEKFKKENKHWDKVNSEERTMLKKMSVNNFEEKLQFNSVRNVIKKEIWKLAMKEVKSLTDVFKAKCAKQVLFYYRFGSTKKRKKKNYLIQISDQTIIMLHDLENLPAKKIDDVYREGFRILRQYQIKEIFWREANQSNTSDYRRKVWDAIHATDAERKYNVTSGKLKSVRKAAGKIIKENLDKQTFKIFKKDCALLNLSAMGDYMEKYKMYHISDHIWKYFRTFGRRIIEGKISWEDKKDKVRSLRQNYTNKKRLLNKMERYSKWIRNKYREAEVKEKMIYNEDGTMQEITEENWNERFNQLANQAMDPYSRLDILKFVNFRFDWNRKSKVREDNKQFKSEHMPGKRNITSNFLSPHRAYLQAYSLDEFNFVFSHLRMGSTSNYNSKAIK